MLNGKLYLHFVTFGNDKFGLVFFFTTVAVSFRDGDFLGMAVLREKYGESSRSEKRLQNVDFDKEIC